ncbi:MAG: transporter [Candidatus Sericytochromatia bacterium]
MIANLAFSQSKSDSSKNHYHIFNPTPKNLMRGFETDRPDITESAYSVDAGHFQYEGDLVVLNDNLSSTDRTKEFIFNNMNLKIGLTNNTDIQFVIPTYTMSNTEGNKKSSSNEFGGDLVTRLKINLFGNDEGAVAAAIMPYVKIPLNKNIPDNSFEGGFTVPFSVELPLGFGLGFMAQYDYIKNEQDKNYHSEFVTTFAIGHDITETLGAYVEIFSQSSTEKGSEWNATLDGGITYAINEDIQLDCGINWGLTESSDKFNPFLGLSFRI